MTKNSVIDYPYEIKELTPEENEDIRNVLKVITDLEGGGGTELTKSLSNSQFRDVLKELQPMTIDQIKELPSPRFIKTHLPISLLPPKILDTAKVVYVARDPRDIVVSFYHHNKLMRILNPEVELKPQWELFIQNKIMWTPYFEHLLEAWQKRNHPNLLFLFYEDLSKDLSASIRRVAEFLGKPITEEEVATLQEHLTFDNFKNNKSVNMENLQNAGVFKKDEAFIRKGKVGGWRDYFDDEMTAQAEKWIADNIRDSDFRFPHF